MKQHQDAREAERAAKRRGILERMRREVSEAQTKAEDYGDQAAKQCVEVERLQREAAEARHRLLALEAASANAAQRAEGAEGQALRELRPLGGDALEAALLTVRQAQRAAQGSAALRVTGDTFDKPGQHELTNAEALERAARLAVLAEKLEALRLADVAPAEIERIAAEAVREAEGER